MRTTVFMLVLGISLQAMAVDESPPQLEPLPPQEAEEQELQPEITIRRRGQNVVEEYRIGGRLYMIKVTPPVGPPYYLRDTDGDGTMDVRRSDIEWSLRTHQWKILEW